jgi:hypothetical protein
MASRLEIWFRKNYETHYNILLVEGLADDSANKDITLRHLRFK